MMIIMTFVHYSPVFYSLLCRIHKSSLSQKYPSYITWEIRYNHTDSIHTKTHPSNVNKFMLEIRVAAQSFQNNMKISVTKRRRSEKAHICSNGNKLRQSNIKTSSSFTETLFCGTTHCSKCKSHGMELNNLYCSPTIVNTFKAAVDWHVM